MEKRKRTVMMAILRTRRAWMEHTKAVAHEMGIPDSYRMIIMYLLREPGPIRRMLRNFVMLPRLQSIRR